MGIEYALVCDKTMEAYELGKGLWLDYGEGPPRTREETRARVFEESSGWDVSDTYREIVAIEVWTFIETHPGCRVVNDGADVCWDTDPFTGDDVQAFGKENLFKQVGSRYKER